MAPRDDGIGASVRRKEDLRFLTGRGIYTDDINRPGQLHAYILRSPHAACRISARSTRRRPRRRRASSPSSPAPTWPTDNVGGLPCGWLIKFKDGSADEGAAASAARDRTRAPCRRPGRRRHRRQPRAGASDAAELIEVDYKPLPARGQHRRGDQAGGAAALGRRARQHLLRLGAGRQGARPTRRSRRRTRSRRSTSINNRLIPNAMEPRAAIGEFDRATGDYTLYTTSQNPHVIRLLMGAFVLHIPESKLRVVAPDVGGGFGSKIYHYAEEAIVTWAAGKVRRPVKWTADRSESFMSDAHGRDHVTQAELALDKDGKFLALQVATLANMGAYLSTFATCDPDLSLRHPARRHLHDAGDLRRGAGGVHQHRAGRRLSRRRPPGGDVPARAPRRHRGARDEHRSASSCAGATSSRTTPSPTRRRSRCNTTAATTRRRSTRRSRRRTGPASRSAAQEAKARGKMRGIGIATYIEACGIAPSAVVGSLGARAGFYEIARGARAPDRLRHRLHRQPQPRPGPRDDLRAARRRRPRHPDRQRRDRARRHRQDPVRHGHLRLALAGGRRLGDRQGDGQGRSTRARRSPPTCSRRPRPTSSSRTASSRSPAPTRARRSARSRWPPTCRTTIRIDELEPGLDETAFYDPKNFTFPAGATSPRSRSIRRPASPEIVNFTAVGRFRPHHQPDDRRGPGAWRRGAGHRPGAARALRLRQETASS